MVFQVRWYIPFGSRLSFPQNPHFKSATCEAPSNFALVVPSHRRALNGHFVSDVYTMQRNIIFWCGTSGRKSLKWMPCDICSNDGCLATMMAGDNGSPSVDVRPQRRLGAVARRLTSCCIVPEPTVKGLCFLISYHGISRDPRGQNERVTDHKTWQACANNAHTNLGNSHKPRKQQVVG